MLYRFHAMPHSKHLEVHNILKFLHLLRCVNPLALQGEGWEGVCDNPGELQAAVTLLQLPVGL